MPQVVTELTGGVASYVARLPMPAINATEWAKTLHDDSPPLALPNDADAKPFISNDDKDEGTSWTWTWNEPHVEVWGGIKIGGVASTLNDSGRSHSKTSLSSALALNWGMFFIPDPSNATGQASAQTLRRYTSQGSSGGSGLGQAGPKARKTEH